MATSKIPKILTVEGIIASGKTTLLSKLQKQLPHLNMKIIPEPIASWENTTKFKPIPNHFIDSNKLFQDQHGIINGDNSKQDQFQLLSQMYKDSDRWCFSFQLWALYTRIKSIELVMNECYAKNENVDVFLIERSSNANRIFASIMYDNQYLNECEWLMYNHFFDYFNEKCSYLLDGIIYLNCPTDIAMERIKERHRKGEENISHQYQMGLQQKHDEWLNHNQIPMLEVGVPYDKSLQTESETFENIHTFIKNVNSVNSIHHSLQNQSENVQMSQQQQQIHKL